MFYVGTSLKTLSGDTDPCLVNPSLSVAGPGDFTQRQTDYWPSYTTASPSARQAYLKWLADGRQHPRADIGYVFLFFYGLERRAVLDAPKDAQARRDLPLITNELRRLLSVYGSNGSFLGYATALLDWISLLDVPGKLYEQLVPDLPRSFELPFHLRLALGQAAADGVPVSPHLALAWARLEPNTYLRTPATRCPEQFEKLFRQKYAEAFGAGIVLPKNRTKLEFVYRGASSGLRGRALPLDLDGLPDVTAVTRPLQKLRQVVDAATTELDAYSRFVGRNPEARSSLEGALLLPPVLWPDRARAALQALQARVAEGVVCLPLRELLDPLGAQSAPTRERMLALARALEGVDIAIEPDILDGAKVPKPDDSVVLFSVLPGGSGPRSAPAYRAAALTLQLACAVAQADGDFSAAEREHLREQAQSWLHLAPNHVRRLLAHLQLLEAAPVPLSALKKKLEPLDVAAKAAIAAFIATVAQADGEVSADEVRMLEKSYKALGLDPKQVYTDVHAAASPAAPAAAKTTAAPARGFTLDADRIAALQRDTQHVSALLANIFADEPAPAPVIDPAASVEPAPDIEPESERLLGLDEAHAALARLLLSRPAWSRDQLLDAAADLELMLDGALERINEASFDAHDMSFTEGDDPLTVNGDILEKVAA